MASKLAGVNSKQSKVITLAVGPSGEERADSQAVTAPLDEEASLAISVANTATAEWNAARRTEAAIARATGTGSKEHHDMLMADKMSDEVCTAVSEYLKGIPFVVRRLVLVKLNHRIKAGVL